MDEPLYIVYNAAKRLATTTNFNLLVYADRIVAVHDFDFRLASHGLRSSAADAIEDARLKRRLGMPATRGGVRETEAQMRREQAARMAHVRKMAEDELLAQSGDNHIVRLDSIHEARFRKRAGICRLSLLLADGDKQTWRWLSRYSPAEDVQPVLRGVFGERLAG
jgi:hypothetical protein